MSFKCVVLFHINRFFDFDLTWTKMIGATTENPSFKLTGALLSRCRLVKLKHVLCPSPYVDRRVFVLERLTNEDIQGIVHKAIERVVKSQTSLWSPEIILSSQSEPSNLQTMTSEPPTSSPLLASSPSGDFTYASFPQLTPKILSSIASLATGDARTALSLLELALFSPKDSEESSLLTSLRRSVSASYDRTGDTHYDMISALHKSVRGSAGSAAMYWLARMLSGGEDPIFIARRMIVCASEDIGLADNHALPLVRVLRLQ